MPPLSKPFPYASRMGVSVSVTNLRAGCTYYLRFMAVSRPGFTPGTIVIYFDSVVLRIAIPPSTIISDRDPTKNKMATFGPFAITVDAGPVHTYGIGVCEPRSRKRCVLC